MADEHDDKLDKDQGTGTEVPTPPVIDDWASAFESLEPATPADAEGDKAGADDVKPEGVDAAAAPAEGTVPNAGDAPVDSGDTGGSLPADPGDGDIDESVLGGDVSEVIETYTEDIKTKALEDTLDLFMNRTDDQGNKLIRQTDGRLGATINDSDIYRVDPDTGAPTFYNPDTGKPFTGDNPRAQAKQWVDGYNEELRDTFNRLAEDRETALETEMQPVIDLLKFTPTFEKLDPIRQQMLEAIIGDYEVFDASGDHIGYSCDLDKALAQVNRQIASIQATRATQVAPVEPSGPALDMPNSGAGTSGARPEFKSLGEAIEWDQNQQLEKLRKK